MKQWGMCAGGASQTRSLVFEDEFEVAVGPDLLGSWAKAGSEWSSLSVLDFYDIDHQT